jgi:two-component system sensor histidine kinase RegB
MAGHLLGMWIAFTLAAGVITFFIGTVSETLRRRQKEILKLQQQVARQERLASLVTLAAGAAHEMGTPLGTIAIAAHEIERAAGETAVSELSGDARLIREQVERCREILARMSARGGEPLGEAPVRIQPKQLFARVKENLPAGLRSRLIIETPPNLGSVELPVEATAQALSALVNNGFDASAGGAVSLSMSAGENGVRFVVSDQGEGMDPATVARVAEPFFTTKPAGKGMGLGAFLAHLFATRMGGSLVYDSAPGKGTTAMLSLPLHVQ